MSSLPYLSDLGSQGFVLFMDILLRKLLVFASVLFVLLCAASIACAWSSLDLWRKMGTSK